MQVLAASCDRRAQQSGTNKHLRLLILRQEPLVAHPVRTCFHPGSIRAITLADAEIVSGACVDVQFRGDAGTLQGQVQEHAVFGRADQVVAAVNQEASAAAAKVAEKERRYVAEALEKELSKFAPPVAKELKAALDTPAPKRTAAQNQLLSLHPSVNISPGLLSQYNPTADTDLQKDRAKVAAIQARAPVEDFLRVLTENPGELPPTFLFYRGEFGQPRQEEEPGDLTVCAAAGESGAIPRRDSKRRRFDTRTGRFIFTANSGDHGHRQVAHA